MVSKLVVGNPNNFFQSDDVLIKHLIKNMVQNVKLCPFYTVLTLRKPNTIQVRFGDRISLIVVLMLAEILSVNKLLW